MKTERLITLKSWYQTRMERIKRKGQMKDLAIYGPVSAFYYAARGQYGGDYAVKSRKDWNELFKEWSKKPESK